MVYTKAIYVYIFWVDNVFSSLVASALCEIFPHYAVANLFTTMGILKVLAYDMIVVLVTFFLCLVSIRAFRISEQEKEAQAKPSQHQAIARDIFAKLLAYACSFTMATSHKMAVALGWLAFQKMLYKKQSGVEMIGSGTGYCKGKGTAAVISLSLAYAISICTLLILLSIILIEVADAQRNKMRCFLLRVLSLSYSIAVGWSIFNVGETIFKCGMPSLYQSNEGEMLRGLITVVIGFFIYTRFIYDQKNFLPFSSSSIAYNGHASSNDAINGARGSFSTRWLQKTLYFLEIAIHVTVALTIVDMYLIPIERNLGEGPKAFAMLFVCAVIVSVLASLMAAYSSENLRQTPLYIYAMKSAGWIAAYSWWYAFDIILKSFYGQAYIVRAFWTLLLGLLVTAATASMSKVFLKVVLSDDLGDDEETTTLVSLKDGSMDGTSILLSQSSLFTFIPPVFDSDDGSTGRNVQEEKEEEAILI